MMYTSYKEYNRPRHVGLAGLFDGLVIAIITSLLIVSGVVGSLIYAFNGRDYSAEKLIRSYVDAFLSVTLGFTLGNFATTLFTPNS